MSLIDYFRGALPPRFQPSAKPAAAADSAAPPADAKPAPPPAPQTANVGHLAREYEDHPARGLTPARLAALMVDAEQGNITDQLDLADDIEERDGHCYAELDKRAGAVASLEWSLAAPEGATAAELDVTARLNAWLMSMDIEGIVRGMMTAVLRGFANHEMEWSLQDDVQLPELTLRPHRWFTVDRETRNQMRLREQNATDGVPLWPLAWLQHVHKTRNGYLARGGLVRVLCWPYLFKNFATRDLAELLEIYGLPLRLGTYPAGASDDEKRTLLRAVTQIGHNAAGIIPAGMLIDFQNASTGNDVPFKTMIDLMDAVQSKVILGQTLTASEGKNGTQALGTVHNDVRMDIRNSDARQIARTLTEQLVRPIALVNIPGVDVRRLPVFQFDTTEPEDLAQFAETLPKLAAAGVKVPVKWVHDKLRIPEPIDDEPVLEAPKPPPAVAPPADGGKPPTKKDEQAALSGRLPAAAHDLLDDLVREAAGDWQPQLAPLVGPLLDALDDAIEAGQTVAQFRAALPQLVERMDYTPLAERMARATNQAALIGAADLAIDSAAA